MNKPINRFAGIRLDARSTKTRIEEMTARGVSAIQIAQKLNVAVDDVWRVQMKLRADGPCPHPDKSSPRWAHHEAHVAAVMAEGGFPALSERRNSRGEPYACLPLVWPGAA